MSDEHKFECLLVWTGAAKGPTSTYEAYSREYRIDIQGKPSIRGSAAVNGSKKRRQISVLQANSLRIRTGNFLPPNRELNRAIREIPALIRESRSRRPFRAFSP